MSDNQDKVPAEKQAGGQAGGQAQAQEKAMRDMILRVTLTTDARDRLMNIRMVKPDLAKSVEDYLIGLASSGKVKKAITDDELKQLLSSAQQPRREFKIKRI
ncbi:MAG: DNA-binding protein [Nitrososphaerales archaeon]